MRAFLAVPVTEPALAELSELGARLRAGVDGVRWAPLATAHVTLHFFGAISQRDSARALTLLGPVVERHPTMRLRLRGLGCFPTAARPRVLWAGVDGDRDALAALQAACADALVAGGFPVEQRAYRPHCTLGRVRSGWSGAARTTWEEVVAAAPTGVAFIADRVMLYESLPGPDGVRHRELVALPMRG